MHAVGGLAVYLFMWYSFIHSLRKFIWRLYKSTTTQRRSRLQHWHCVGVNTPKRYRQLWVKDLPHVPTWRKELDWSLQPSGRKAPNLPLSHHATQMYVLWPTMTSFIQVFFQFGRPTRHGHTCAHECKLTFPFTLLLQKIIFFSKSFCFHTCLYIIICMFLCMPSIKALKIEVMPMQHCIIYVRGMGK